MENNLNISKVIEDNNTPPVILEENDYPTLENVARMKERYIARRRSSIDS